MLVTLFRAVILYLLLVILIRLMGKRQIGEMGPTEFVVTMMIADLASVPMQDLHIPLLSGIVPILAILAIELLFSSLSYYSVSLRTIFCGKPIILMRDGLILQDSLRKTRITPDELTQHLRDKGILDLSSVKYAILETNGVINAFADSQYQPPTASDLDVKTETLEMPWTIISSGKVLTNNLNQSGYSQKWLQHILHSHRCSVSEILLMTVTKTGKVYLSMEKEHS